MKRALDAVLYDGSMVLLNDGKIYPRCADCGTHDLDSISFCPWCGKELI